MKWRAHLSVYFAAVVLVVNALVCGQANLIEFPEGKSQVEIQLRRGGGLLFLPVRLNGHDAGLFILDTGMSSTMIDSSLASELKLSALGNLELMQSRMQASMYALDEIDAAGVKSHQAFAMAADMTQIREATGLRELKGGIGDRFFLDRMPFTLSWSKARLTLYQEAPKLGPEWHRVTLRFFEAMPSINVKLPNENAGWFKIDSGSDGGLSLTPEFARSNASWLRSLSWLPEGSAQIDGMHVVREVHVPYAEFAGFPIERAELDYSFQAGGRATGAAGTIEGRILHNYEITFDYKANEAWVRPDPDRGIPAEWSQADFDSHAADLMGVTPLMRAAGMRRSDYVNRFLESGAKVDAEDFRKATALCYAIGDGDSAIAEKLISAGSPINTVTRLQQATPLLIAAEQGMTETVRLLIAHGAKIEATDVLGRSPLIAAAESGNRATAEVLIKAGADLHVISPSAGSALNAAAMHGASEVAQLLLESGADVTKTDRLKTPLLVTAASADSTAMVKLLLAKGLDPNALNSSGQTPLIEAVINGNAEIVSLLLDHGADPSITDHDHKTAMQYAVSEGQTECMHILYFDHRPTTSESKQPNDGRRQ